MENRNDLKDRTLTLQRTFDAPIELVWEAWTEAEHIIKWWGPKGMETKVETHEFKVGGQWKYTMVMPDGNLFIAEGEYLEIEEKTKIVSTANFRPMTEGVEMHALFNSIGDKTEFTFSVIHETVEYCQQQEKMGFYNGWGSTFERLDELLTSRVG